VLTTAREANPNIVSVLITGMTDHSATVKAINEGGIWKYVAKPWEPAELTAVVTEGLERYRQAKHREAELTRLAKALKDPAAEAPKRITVRHETARDTRAADPFVGSRYHIEQTIGEGGMGTVYKATDLLLGMPVAIKLLNERLTQDEQAIATLKEEARIAMQLSHRHIVRLHNLQKERGVYFLVMEYVPGRTLREIISSYGKLPLDTVMQVIRVCADALAYAHRHGVLHKDLKPGNLLLDQEGVLKVIDFGVACLMSAQERAEEVTGTPVFMSPEQLRGEELDARTDVYSLGVMTCELLTGQPPFPLDTTDLQLLAGGPQELPGLPEDMEPVIRKALEPRREDRWPSVEAFATALAEAPERLFHVTK
jgi:serine/threonine-protein kinase